jgi:hypothetical protein
MVGPNEQNRRNRSRGCCCLATTAADSSRKTGLRPRAGVLGSFGPSRTYYETLHFADLRPLRFVRFHRQPSGTASTILAGPPGALGFTRESTADLFEARTLTNRTGLRSYFAIGKKPFIFEV